jgi:hypothetical protein
LDTFRNLQTPITLRSVPVIQIGVTLEISRIWIMTPSDLSEIDRQQAKGDFSEKLEKTSILPIVWRTDVLNLIEELYLSLQPR